MHFKPCNELEGHIIVLKQNVFWECFFMQLITICFEMHFKAYQATNLSSFDGKFISRHMRVFEMF